VVFTEVRALEISAFISRKLDFFNKDQRLISDIYRPALTTYTLVLLAILGSYINKLIS
jgi:hypothetical protein